MSLVAADGYEYASLKDRLLGKPQATPRNIVIAHYRRLGQPEGLVKAWIEGYDFPEKGTHAARVKNADLAVHRWLYPETDEGRDRTCVPAPESSPSAAVHPAYQPSVPRGLGA